MPEIHIKWSESSKGICVNSLSLEEVIQTFLESNKPSDTEIELSVAIYINGKDNVYQTPSMHLDPELLQLLASMKIYLDIDLYVIG